ncbi:MAG TPA: hypothetical protein VGM34_00235 [Chlamydiales bacterium]|jgi:hypothetical protein
MHIGIDFDNTIVCYDDVFYKAALEQKLIPLELPPSKTSIRDYFRSAGKEDDWTRLQGYVYGTRMDLAHPFSGIDRFFKACHENKIKISIVSHKTRHPYMGPKYDLHAAAREWLLKQPFFNQEISLFFELTLLEKLDRIRQLQCDFFIDDLPELLSEPKFPEKTRKILFDPANFYQANTKWQTLTSWDQMLSILKSLSTS